MVTPALLHLIQQVAILALQVEVSLLQLPILLSLLFALLLMVIGRSAAASDFAAELVLAALLPRECLAEIEEVPELGMRCGGGECPVHII